ncbi:hypothetical protein YerA41_011 [Yersinia phage YerA41]|nr:hypothetical protein YerA41_011 [Yersinia phage YerA41]
MRKLTGKFILTSIIVMRGIKWPDNADNCRMIKDGTITFYSSSFIREGSDIKIDRIVKEIPHNGTDLKFLNDRKNFYETVLTREQFIDHSTHGALILAKSFRDYNVSWLDKSKIVGQNRTGSLVFANTGLSRYGDHWNGSSINLIDRQLASESWNSDVRFPRIERWTTAVLTRDFYDQLIQLSGGSNGKNA